MELAIEKRQVLIVHGWSDSYQSFQPLKNLLVAAGYQTTQVFLGNYASMRDEVTFDDLATGLQQRFVEMIKDGALNLEPFSLDVIVHSTGGPVVRHWLNHYLRDICGGDLARCPVRSLIMLAPANFGSRLAAQGKSALAKLFKGGMKNGFETGKRILEGLELGSPVLWQIAHDDLFATQRRYPCTPQGPFVYVLSGSDTYGQLKGLVAKGANENGSDGTVRAAAASMNSIKINANYTQPDHAKADIVFQPNEPFAFRIMPSMNHSTIVPRADATATNATFVQIQECLRTSTLEQYKVLTDQWENDTKAFFAAEKAKPSDQSVDPHQQFIVRVRDEIGNDVTDYRLDFHVVDASIRTSAWQNDDEELQKEALRKLQAYQDLTMFLTEEVLLDVQPHSVNPSYRTFFVNLRRLEELRARLQADARRPYIGMNVDAVPRGLGLTYATDELRYVPVDRPLEVRGGQPVTFFKESTSTLVDITLQGVQGREVIQVL
jgi:pimeloyl-ACP methyl ester carboxylesterase